MNNHPWVAHYPAGVPHVVNVNRYETLTEMLDANFKQYATRVAYRFMGRSYSYDEVQRLAALFASFLQSKGLKKGDRVGIMMPNLPQYPVVAAAILKAGMVVVNINPLYTPRELEHQLKDSGTKLIVILENFARVFEAVQKSTACQHVVLASIGDLLGPAKGMAINFLVRRVRRAVPAYSLLGAVRFSEALRQGQRHKLHIPDINANDVAVLQYTGGTTGVSKGATLLHCNLVANMLQCQAWFQSALKSDQDRDQVGLVCALPLYHIYAFTGIMLLGLCVGGRTVLIANPRDAGATLKSLSKEVFHVFPGVNTLFNTYARHPAFRSVAWRHLRLTLSAGMATQKATAELWKKETGSSICEAFGMSETSPLVACNPINAAEFSGSIGIPVPNTELALFDDDGRKVSVGLPGELAVRGPQVMAGYWNRPDETAKVIRPDGYLLTGDIAIMDERGYFKIVDRKKDMILVSGFNVYPNEIEDVITQMPGVLECAAIGIQDAKSGEVMKVFIVKSDNELTEQLVRAYCESYLTGYKRPKYIEFTTDLPKSNVGKILRRELKEMERKRDTAPLSQASL